MNSQIAALIRNSVSAAIKNISTEDDTVSAAVIGRQANPHLVLNSSFISRDKRSLQTAQASRRLVARLVGKGKHVAVDDLSVTDDKAIRDHYKLISPTEKLNILPLEQAVNQELEAVGDLIFVLVGKLESVRVTSQAVGGRAVSELRLDPQLKSKIKRVGGATYAVSSLVSVEDLLSQIQSDLEQEGGLSDGERTKIAEGPRLPKRTIGYWISLQRTS